MLVARMHDLLDLRAESGVLGQQVLDPLERGIRLEQDQIRLPAAVGIVDQLHQVRGRYSPADCFQAMHTIVGCLCQRHECRGIGRAPLRDRRIDRQDQALVRRDESAWRRVGRPS